MDQHTETDDDRRDPFMPPTPTPATVRRAATVTGAGFVVLVVGLLLLRFVACDGDTCTVGPAMTAGNVVATVGFLVVLVGAAYGLTAMAHLWGSARARERRGEE